MSSATVTTAPIITLVATPPATTAPAPKTTASATTAPAPKTTTSVTSMPTYVPLDGPITPNPVAMDPSTLMNVLSNYLVNSPLIHNNIGDYNHVDDQIDNINQQLSSINNALDNQTTGSILSHQDSVATIVNTEMNRLNSKQQSIDSAMATQKRMLQMNDSYLKRQQVYMRIMIAIVIALVILIVCKVLSGYFGDDSGINVLLSIVSILVIVFVVIYCGWALVMMWRRDPIYYDQLHYIPDNQPATLTGNTGLTVGQIVSAGAVGAAASTYSCIGSACCSPNQGTVWDPSMNACIKEGFAQGPGSIPTYDADTRVYAHYA